MEIIGIVESVERREMIQTGEEDEECDLIEMCIEEEWRDKGRREEKALQSAHIEIDY